MKAENWKKKRAYTQADLDQAVAILEEIKAGTALNVAQRAHPKPDGGGFIPKHALVAVYTQMVESGTWPEDEALLAKIRMKPTRTLSGVTTVTVLTRYHPCPGECIFCPQEDRLPKSYLSEEPGAKRGVENNFDPYLQVSNRIRALEAVGHPTDKIELLILGGSFSVYPRDYQTWFVQRCFDAMNTDDPAHPAVSDTLAEAQLHNVHAAHRNVGLVIETRPDLVNRAALARYRELGVTKVQMGAQSLDDHSCGRAGLRSFCTGCPTCWGPHQIATVKISPGCGVRAPMPPTRSRSTPASFWRARNSTSTGSKGIISPILKRLC